MTAVRSVGGIVRGKAAKEKDNGRRSSERALTDPGSVGAANRAQPLMAEVAGSSSAGVHQFTVRCDLPPSELSPNHNKKSWAAKYRKGKSYRQTCGWVMKTAMPPEWKPGAVVVDVTYRHSKESQGYRPRDEDNARSSLKSLFDALADAGVVPHDSAKLVRWGAFKLETQKGGERDGIYLTVRRV